MAHNLLKALQASKAQTSTTPPKFLVKILQWIKFAIAMGSAKGASAESDWNSETPEKSDTASKALKM